MSGSQTEGPGPETTRPEAGARSGSAVVGIRVRAARERAGMTQEALAGKLGITQTAVSYWEAGKRDIGVADLERIAAALGIRAASLLPLPHQSHEASRPSLRQRAGDQRLPVRNDSRDIQSMVIDDIRARREVGISRYGTALQPHNGRDAFRDLYEELLDAVMYVRQVMAEREGLVLVDPGDLREVVPWILPPSRGGHVSQDTIDRLSAAAEVTR